MLVSPEKKKQLEENIASTEAGLDQAQAHYNRYKHLWTEEYAWQIQSDIDIKRFQLELAKLQFQMFSEL
jgi:multidrug resistance efflux pump